MGFFLISGRFQPCSPSVPHVSQKHFSVTASTNEYVCMYVSMYVCIFIKLHITAQSGLSSESFYATCIDPPKGGSMILVTKTSDQTRQRVCMYVCMYVCIAITNNSKSMD